MLVHEEPLVRVLAAAPALDQDQAPPELVAGHVRVQLAGCDGRDRVVCLVRLPGAGIPDDHVAAAVLAGRDHALEVDVLDRVILDVNGEPLGCRVEGRAVRHRPARQDTIHLEAQVVVAATGPMPLYDEPELAVGLLHALAW